MDEIKLYAFHPAEALFAIMVVLVIIGLAHWRGDRQIDRAENRRQEILKNWGKPTEEPSDG